MLFGYECSALKQQQLTELKCELQAVMVERDDALLKMANAQEQANLNAESIKNLQTVLEQFQRGVFINLFKFSFLYVL